MRILVCLKQVPHLNHLQNADGASHLVREGIPLETNPFDRRSLALALNLRDKLGGSIAALTMGPAPAGQALVDALALGCDEAIHLLDESFAGSDCLATARILASACRRLTFDLIVCGRASTDAGAGIVPGLLAALLDLPFLPAVTRLECSDDGRTLVCVRELEDGFETSTCRTPALLSAAERLMQPLKIPPEARAAVDPGRITTWDRSQLRLPLADVGVNGSPTRVAAPPSPPPDRLGRRIDLGANLPAALSWIVQGWNDRGLLSASAVLSAVPAAPEAPRTGSIWVIMESGEEGIRPACVDMLARASLRAVDLHAMVTAVVFGHAAEPAVATLPHWGADHVLLAEAPDLGPLAVEAHAHLLRRAVVRRSPDALLLPATVYGRELAARLAAALGLGVVTECSDFEPDPDEVLRLIRPSFHGGLTGVTCSSRPILATLTPGAFPRPAPQVARRAALERLPWRGDFEPRRRTLAIETSASQAIALDTAGIVLGIGMGVGGPEGVARVQALASRIGAAVAGSRRVVDAGWLPRQTQIGLTGRIIAPRLYLAIGMNGSTYHAAGVRRAGWIAAVNTDMPAALARMADEVMLGDWEAVLPPLVEALAAALPSPAG